MPQTFYIDSDEEIISVIGRLRKSSSGENVFVFPKRALVLQSIVNLRLLQREAQKMGRKITIVSQDEIGKMLAEKAGIRTERYSEDFSQKAPHLELVSQGHTMAARDAAPAPQGALRSEAIGSNEFYSGVPAMPVTHGVSVSSVKPKEGTTLHIRNASPEKLTSLNSKRFKKATMPSGEQGSSARAPRPVISSSTQETVSLKSTPDSPMSNAPQSEHGERLRNFYSGMRTAPIVSAPQKIPRSMPVPISGKKVHLVFLVLGGISLLSLFGAAFFLFLPKADVHITPYKVVRTADIDLNGRTNIAAEDEAAFPVRIIEKEEGVSVTTATTGTSGGTNQKARGTVVIYNNYSAAPQPLVATTRLETPDGRLFRLVSGVTVPGMTGAAGAKEPGAIEAEVIADQSGTEYNIGSSAFTIPGFKGGPKYEKFSAKSTKAMTGGGSGGASDIAVVAAVDIDTAERDAKEKAKEAFLNEIRDTLLPDERVLEEQIDIVALTPAALPQIGTAADAFDYRNTFKIRAFVFSEKTVRGKIDGAVEKELGGIRFKPVSSSITYSDSVPNFATGEVRLKAHALVTMESDIDREKLREGLLGKNEDGIKQTLNGFPEVKKINVVFHPQLFVKSLPDSKDRVSILIEPGEAGE